MRVFFVEHAEYGDFMVIFNQLEFDELWDYVGSHQFGQSLHLCKVPGGVSSLSHLNATGKTPRKPRPSLWN